MSLYDARYVCHLCDRPMIGPVRLQCQCDHPGPHNDPPTVAPKEKPRG